MGLFLLLLLVRRLNLDGLRLLYALPPFLFVAILQPFRPQDLLVDALRVGFVAGFAHRGRCHAVVLTAIRSISLHRLVLDLLHLDLHGLIRLLLGFSWAPLGHQILGNLDGLGHRDHRQRNVLMHDMGLLLRGLFLGLQLLGVVLDVIELGLHVPDDPLLDGDFEGLLPAELFDGGFFPHELLQREAIDIVFRDFREICVALLHHRPDQIP